MAVRDTINLPQTVTLLCQPLEEELQRCDVACIVRVSLCTMIQHSFVYRSMYELYNYTEREPVNYSCFMGYSSCFVLNVLT